MFDLQIITTPLNATFSFRLRVSQSIFEGREIGANLEKLLNDRIEAVDLAVRKRKEEKQTDIKHI